MQYCTHKLVQLFESTTLRHFDAIFRPKENRQYHFGTTWIFKNEKREEAPEGASEMIQ